jgi:hypothetical protein
MIIECWTRTIGTAAYIITDTYGCVPYNDDFQFLTGGMRSRAFRIIQTTNFAWATLYGPVSLIDMYTGFENRVERRDGSLREYQSQRVWMGFIVTFTLAFVEIAYFGLIASKGAPVAISGNCMLVELDPYLGFFDAEISHYWKVLVGLTGL